MLLFLLLLLFTRIHSHSYVLSQCSYVNSYHTHAFDRILCTRSLFRTYRSAIFTSSFSRAVFLSCFRFRIFISFTYYRDSSLRICRPIYIFHFVSHRFHFVCLLVCFVKFSVSLRLFVSLSFSYFCRIELFIETQPRPFCFLAESIFFRFSHFLFAFYKNVHLLRLNSRQLFNFSSSRLKIQQHTIRIWLYRCSLALQLKCVSWRSPGPWVATQIDISIDPVSFVRDVLGPFVHRFAFLFVPSHILDAFSFLLLRFPSRMERTDYIHRSIRSICSRPTDPECGFSVYYY